MLGLMLIEFALAGVEVAGDLAGTAVVAFMEVDCGIADGKVFSTAF